MFLLLLVTSPSCPFECCFSKAHTLQDIHQDDHAEQSYQSPGDGSSCIHSKTHSVPTNPPNSQSQAHPPRTHQQQSSQTRHTYPLRAPQSPRKPRRWCRKSPSTQKQEPRRTGSYPSAARSSSSSPRSRKPARVPKSHWPDATAR